MAEETIKVGDLVESPDKTVKGVVKRIHSLDGKHLRGTLEGDRYERSPEGFTVLRSKRSEEEVKVSNLQEGEALIMARGFVGGTGGTVTGGKEMGVQMSLQVVGEEEQLLGLLVGAIVQKPSLMLIFEEAINQACENFKRNPKLMASGIVDFLKDIDKEG